MSLISQLLVFNKFSINYLLKTAFVLQLPTESNKL